LEELHQVVEPETWIQRSRWKRCGSTTRC